MFRQYRPQVVFHAAALKHLTLLERHPQEAVKTNVLATTHLLEYSTTYGVERFVNISTDKAADPISILGYTKRIAERLTSTWAGISGRPFVSVRFGNVLGSRGSVVPAFRDMIENGRPVTVTHPEVTRFFMTIQEACQLVIQAGAIGKPGEVLILDMGEPVRITELARQLIDASGRTDIDIIYTGLRRGEKLHEELIGEGERDVRPGHPLIMQNPVPPLTVEAVRSALADSTPTTLSRLSSWVQPGTERDRALQPISA